MKSKKLIRKNLHCSWSIVIIVGESHVEVLEQVHAIDPIVDYTAVLHICIRLSDVESLPI